MHRIRILLLLVMAMGSGAAVAQAYPSKTVRLVVATTAAGLTDTVTRAIAQNLTKLWGQPVIVENRPGASTIVAAAYVAKAPADGYTILMANDPTLSSNQYLYSKLPYDPVKDFAPVINVYEAISMIVARNGFGARTLPELIAMARAKPDDITYASFGPGSKTHLDTEALAFATGTRLRHIPYKGVAEVLTALVAAQIDVALSAIPPTLPYLRSGQIKAIAIGGPNRFPLLPDVPTFAEAGIPNVESRSWFGFVVPAGTPRPVIDKIAADVSRVITQPEFLEQRITGVGLRLLNQGPDEFAEFLKRDRADYEARVNRVGVKLD